MKTPLRHLYNPAFFERLCPVLEECIPGFETRDFIFRIFNNAWPDFELQERTRHMAAVLDRFLPGDASAAMQMVLTITQSLKSRAFFKHGYEHLFLARYIECYGEKHPDLSGIALQELQEILDSHPVTEPLFLANR